MPLKVETRPATAGGTRRLRRGLLRQMVHAILNTGNCRQLPKSKAGPRVHATPQDQHQAQRLFSPWHWRLT